jgi:segregation and condensation protein A
MEENPDVGQTGDENSPGSDGKVGQEQIQGLLFGDKVSWQAIIYDLINTEQLNPWDIDLVLLTNKFLERVRGLEEANFFVSSKVLLAAALLLRIKSEILLNQDIPELDDILFGRKEDKKYEQERLELDEELPDLVPRTPLPRFRKVSLQELMNALGKAIQTETRRLKKVVVENQHEMETQVALPKNTINIRDQIKEIYQKLRSVFSDREHRLAFSELAGEGNDEKIATFYPLLHLDNQHRVVLEQEGHFEEIWIWLKSIYDKTYKEELERLRKEVEIAMEEDFLELDEEQKERAEQLEDEFENPIGEE